MIELQLQHECDTQYCEKEAEYCYCAAGIEEIKQEAYDLGFKEGKASNESDAS